MIGKEILFSNDEIEIYEGPCENIYYRGVKSNFTYKSVLTYNVKKEMELAEDGLIKNLFGVGNLVFLAAINADEYTARKIIACPEGFEIIFVTSIGVEVPSDFNFPDHFSQVVKEKGALRPFVDLAKQSGLIGCQERIAERNFTCFYADVKQLCEFYGVKLQYNGKYLKIPTNTLPLN